MNLLRVYGDCLLSTLKALRRSPWTLLLPVGYLYLLTPIQALIAPLGGFLGGLLLSAAVAALAASVLYVVSELVRGSPVRLREMPQSVRHFFWPILNVAFVFWIAGFLLNPMLAHAPNGKAIHVALRITLFVLFNAVPEVIYQRGEYGGIAAIVGSVKFLEEHWIEWLIPNLAIGAAAYYGIDALTAVPYAPIAAPVILGACLLAYLAFRGFLFQAVDGSGIRQAAMRRRFGGR
jgi:hypothetical protein